MKFVESRGHRSSDSINSVPDLTLHDSPAPVPELPVPELPVPELPVPEVPVPELPVPKLPVPELPVPELPVPELPVPELPVPELPVPDHYISSIMRSVTTDYDASPEIPYNSYK